MLLMAVPVILFVGVLRIWVWWTARGKRKPTTEKMLRPPGESLRKNLEQTYEEFFGRILEFILPSALLPLFYDIWPFCNSFRMKAAFWIALVFWLGLLFYLGRKICAKMTLYRNLTLGYNGERYVGEMLNHLMLEGCHIFHDYPADPKWNIDHIIVGSTGVFSVETKARRKNTAGADSKTHAVIYDGTSLTFPTGKDSEMIEQATRNASWLARDLSKAIGEPVAVKPILTLPGWWVERKAKNDLAVLNPKEIRTHILNGKPASLSPEKIKRIIYQLDQKCRDVEF